MFPVCIAKLTIVNLTSVSCQCYSFKCSSTTFLKVTTEKLQDYLFQNVTKQVQQTNTKEIIFGDKRKQDRYGPVSRLL
jgi:hypothetical protein